MREVRAGTRKSKCPRASMGYRLRPTTARVRDWIFSVVDVQGKDVVIDIFAGTGALGIEALRRGAGAVTFVDSDLLAVRGIRESLGQAGAWERCKVLRRDALRFLGALSSDTVDIVLADPPYGYARAGALVSEAVRVLKRDGRFVMERPSGGNLPESEDVVVVREKRFGGTTVTVLRRGE